jgi:glycosyltransferase involved in cell wall biosynthesis
MKILLVNDYGIPTGGAEVLLLGLRDSLRARGHDARLFTSSARPSAGVNQADYECLGTTSCLRTLLQTCNPWAYWKLRQVLSRFRPDVVHVGLFLTQLSPFILLPLRRIPTLYFAMWYRASCPLGTKLLPDGTPCRKAPGLVCYRANCLPLRDWAPLMLQHRLWLRWRRTFRLIVAHSAYLRNRLECEGIDVQHVISGMVPLHPARPALTQPPTAGFVGRLVREKGVDVLVRAFAKVVVVMPEARLILVGDGPEHSRIQALVQEMGLNSRVSLPGRLSRSATQEVLAGAWVQVVPSRWEEPFGLSALDAMMRGTAVIASDIGGLRESVDHGRTGLLIPASDSSALAKALLRLLADRDLTEHMGRTAREIVQSRFSDAQFTDRFLQLYAGLMASDDQAGGRDSPSCLTGRDMYGIRS